MQGQSLHQLSRATSTYFQRIQAKNLMTFCLLPGLSLHDAACQIISQPAIFSGVITISSKT